MFKKLLGMGLAAVSTVVAACEGAPTTQQVYRRHDDVLSSLQEASMKGPVLLEVHGNPFVTGQGHLDQILTDELQGAIQQIRGITFTTDPEAAGNPKYRMVLALGAKANQGGEAMCTAEEPIVTETTDPIRTVAVFCIKDTLYSEVRGSIKASAAPDDKQFRKWIGQIARDLFLSLGTLMWAAPLGMD